MNLRRAFAAGMRAAGAASSDWWLPAGITQSDVIQVFQPKGAASYADSLFDLSGNGNHASAPASPGWNVADGWVFTGSQYLDSNAIPPFDGSASIFIRYSDAETIDGMWLYGYNYDASNRRPRFRVQLDYDADNRILVINGPNLYFQAAAEPTSGVMGCYGSTPFHTDGTVSFVLQSPLSHDDNGAAALIGAAISAGEVSGFYVGNIQAIALYNTPLSAAQANAVIAEMESL